MTLIEAIAEIVSERGYLVLSSLVPLRIGHRFAIICELEQPFVIVAEATTEDALTQRRLLDQKRGEYFVEESDRLFHYRAMTD